MRRITSLSIVVLLALLIGPLGAAAQTRIPATANFRDAAGDRIQSDHYTNVLDLTYRDGIDCVISYTGQRMASYFLRTTSGTSSGLCTTTNPRGITLDFSSPVSPPSTCSAFEPRSGLTLNTCGLNPSVADVRVIAQRMSTTAVITMPINLKPFVGPAFELDFEQPVPVTAPATNVRVIDAGQLTVAELYQYVVQSSGKGSTKVSIGRYYMPFQLTVTKQ